MRAALYAPIVCGLIALPPAAAELRTNPAELRTDPMELQTNSVELRTNPAQLPTNTAELRTNPAELRTNPAEPQTNPAQLPTNTAELRTNPAELRTNPAELWTNPAELRTNPAEPDETEALEIGLVLLDPGADGGGARERGAFPDIRKAEAGYLPYALRRSLVDSNHWGAVRVLPEAATGVEILVTGSILHSDGVRLKLALKATDSRGQVWFDEPFSATAPEGAYRPANRRLRRPFQALYDGVANRLLEGRRRLTARELADIRRIAELRYAEALAPEAFDGFLDRDEQGHYRLRRLPARGDPMLERIERVRAQEYLFIDIVDEQYAELFTEMTPVYDLWRRFQREQVEYREAYEERLAERKKPRRGSYRSLKQSYDNYRWAKLQRQEIKLLAEGFDNEVAPTRVEVEGNVFRLSGSLDERHREWRRILREIHALETAR